MKYLILFSLLKILSFNKSFAQDSIKFERNDNKKELIVPLNREIGSITTKDGKHRRIIITSYNDSTIIVRGFNYSLKERRKKRKEFYPILNDTSITWEQKDSIELYVQYSKEEIININSIKKMKISHEFVPNLNKQIKFVNSAIASWLLIFPASVLILPTYESKGVAFIICEVVGIGLCTYAIIFDNKTINFKKWHIKRSS